VAQKILVPPLTLQMIQEWEVLGWQRVEDISAECGICSPLSYLEW